MRTRAKAFRLIASCVVAIVAATPHLGTAATDVSKQWVQKAYVAFYGRPADPAGQEYWAGRMDAEGGSLTSVIGEFGVSDEFKRRYGGLTGTQLVTKIYQQTLGRDPDAGGLAWYVGELQAGRKTLQTITIDVLNGATGDDASTIINRIQVADYYTAKVSTGCPYGVEQDGVNSLSTVTPRSSSITGAKTSIDRGCIERGPYFIEVQDGFPDPTALYRATATEGCWFGANLIDAFDMDGDGRLEILYTLSSGYCWDGKPLLTPVNTRLVIYSLNADGRFVDATESFIVTPYDFGGAASTGLRVDINGDGKYDYIFTTSQDDGRPGEESYVVSQLVALMSGVGNRYAVVPFGSFERCCFMSIGLGYLANGEKFLFSRGSNIYVYRNGVMQGLPSNLPDASLGLGAEFLSLAGKSVSNFLVAVDTYPYDVAGYTLSPDGSWVRTGSAPSRYPVVAKEMFKGWVDNPPSEVSVMNMDGNMILGAGSGNVMHGTCTLRPSPDSGPLVIFGMDAPRITNYTPGALIREGDLIPGKKLLAYSVSDGTVAHLDLTLEGEVVFGNNYNNFECFDVNGDGYDDIVTYALGSGPTYDTMPAIFINRKDGTFKKFVSSQLPLIAPDNPVCQEASLIRDFDGDGIADIVIAPGCPAGPNVSSAGTMKLYKGLKPIN